MERFALIVRLQTVSIIVGPTASGKSGYAEKLMTTHNGAIINADSMQVYDALPLLTAQPIMPAHQDRYHLYGYVNPAEAYGAGRYVDDACAAIDACLSKGQTPMVVGGTGLYIKALLGGLAPMPPISDDVRDKVRAMDAGERLAMLQKYDPAFNYTDKQRQCRALEVVLETGKPIHIWQKQSSENRSPYTFHITCLNPPRDALYARCDARFLSMLEEGALDEVEAFEKAYPEDVFVKKALGYAEILAYLKGDISRDEMIQKASQKTRNYAKRQVTWFRHQLPENVKMLTSF